MPSPNILASLLLYDFTVAYLPGFGLEGEVKLALGHTGIGARRIMERPVLAVYNQADIMLEASIHFHRPPP
jgi:hypothetical protein